MTADLKQRLKQLSVHMLTDAEECVHFPMQQKLVEAAAILLKKAEEVDKDKPDFTPGPAA